MKALFIGGTGLISTAVSKLAIERGWDLTLFNRGQHIHGIPEGANIVTVDINDDEAVRRAMEGKHYDVIAQWIAFKPERVQRDIDLFLGKCDQYILISSAAAYERPMRTWRITESLSLNNRYWQYGRDKRACEATALAAYREKEFPVTIVRPSLTYGDTQIPFAMGSWSKPWSLVQRMLDGKEIVVHGDGTSLWTMTHNSDFAPGFIGLLGNPHALGQAVHIMSPESMTWNQIYEVAANALGVKLNAVHISTDFLAAAGGGKYDFTGSLTGDKSNSVVFDISKLKRLVPGFAPVKSMEQGLRETVQNVLAIRNFSGRIRNSIPGVTG